MDGSPPSGAMATPAAWPHAGLGWRLLAGLLVGAGSVGTIQLFGLTLAAATSLQFRRDAVPGALLTASLVLGVAALLAALGSMVPRPGASDSPDWDVRALVPVVAGAAGAAIGIIGSGLASAAVEAGVMRLCGVPVRGVVMAQMRFGDFGLRTSGPWIGIIAGSIAGALGRPVTRINMGVAALTLGAGIAGAIASAWGGASRTSGGWIVYAWSAGLPVALCLTCLGYAAACAGGVWFIRLLERRPAPIGRPLGLAAAGLVWTAGASALALASVATSLANAPPEYSSLSGRRTSPHLFGEASGFLRDALVDGADLVSLPAVLLLVVAIAWFTAGRRLGR